ncbi:MAG: hypothetical protein JWR16_825 [Nevskia sp.]|nr:hypothetical protein [Nevskia sp.]
MLSLLLTLIAIGAIAYFALKSGSGGHSDSGAALDCEPRIAALVRDTGGVGAAAQAAYDQLPAECRKLLPNPASLAPSPERAPDS